MDTTLIISGLYGSGVDHWQSWFQSQVPNCVRVVQSDWSVPDLTRWSARVRLELNRTPDRVWIVAHSFGCLASVDVAADSSERIAGMMLVAPADPARFGLQKAVPRDVLGVHSIVVASTNDRWMSINDAESWSDSWGSQLINLGAAGHINVSSGHGPWPRGLDIYSSLRGRTSRRASARRSDEDVLELGDI